jgi:hypothetical protein
MNSQKVVTPVKTGVQMLFNCLKRLDSGFLWNDGLRLRFQPVGLTGRRVAPTARRENGILRLFTRPSIFDEFVKTNYFFQEDRYESIGQ